MTAYPTLDEARAAGLMHVNCRHSVSAYQEGITRPMTNTADPEGYAATQKLRYYERNVRQSKRMEAAAGIDPEALVKATRRKLDYQGKIRELVATTTAKRQPYRESLGVSKAQLAKLMSPAQGLIGADAAVLKPSSEVLRTQIDDVSKMTQQQFEEHAPDGYTFVSDLSFSAERWGGQTRLGPKFFAKKTAEQKAETLYHELGHDILWTVDKHPGEREWLLAHMEDYPGFIRYGTHEGFDALDEAIANTYRDVALSPANLKALARFGAEHPTDVWQRTIAALADREGLPLKPGWLEAILLYGIGIK